MTLVFPSLRELNARKFTEENQRRCLLGLERRNLECRRLRVCHLTPETRVSVLTKMKSLQINTSASKKFPLGLR